MDQNGEGGTRTRSEERGDESVEKDQRKVDLGEGG